MYMRTVSKDWKYEARFTAPLAGEHHILRIEVSARLGIGGASTEWATCRMGRAFELTPDTKERDLRQMLRAELDKGVHDHQRKVIFAAAVQEIQVRYTDGLTAS